MAEQAFYRPEDSSPTTSAERSDDGSAPSIKEWAASAFENIATHARQFVEPSLQRIDQIRVESGRKRGLARLNFQIFRQESELKEDQNFLSELSRQMEEAQKDRQYWEQELAYLRGVMDRRQLLIDQLRQQLPDPHLNTDGSS